jgi:5-deoxy-5-amino-3-dehydroquinate synthase
VAIGLVFAAALAEELGRIDGVRVDEHVAVVEAYGLDTAVPEALDHDELLTLMARDKKALDGLTFVLDGPAGVELVSGVDPAAVRAALARTGRRS